MEEMVYVCYSFPQAADVLEFPVVKECNHVFEMCYREMLSMLKCLKSKH